MTIWISVSRELILITILTIECYQILVLSISKDMIMIIGEPFGIIRSRIFFFLYDIGNEIFFTKDFITHLTQICNLTIINRYKNHAIIA